MPRGSVSAIPFEDYAARTLEQNFERGREHFSAGRFFPAHEAWEECWRQAKGSEDEQFFKALAQLGAAYTHIARGNAHGARVLLERALSRLTPYGARHRDTNVHALVAGLEAQLHAAANAERAGRPPALLPVPSV